MAGDTEHYTYLGMFLYSSLAKAPLMKKINLRPAEYKAAYPDAKVIGVKDLVPKMKRKGLELDGGESSSPN